jgi:hypothetical protein
MKKFLAAVVMVFAALTADAQVIVDLNPKCEFVINFNPEGKPALVWLAYNVCRMGFIVQHRADYPAKGVGAIPASFADECSGRSGALEVYVAQREKKEMEKDEYWEDVKKVEEAGFLSEYVWTFFRRDDWPENDKPKKLEEFKRWQAKEIPNHKPETNGKIEFKKKS